MTDNIIRFPKMKLDAPPQSPEELTQKLIEYKTSFAEDISEFLWQHVLSEMVRAGCNFGEDSQVYYPSIILLHEAIKSLHLQTSGIHHPLQDFAAEFIDLEEDSEEDDEKVVDKLE
jgi:hypothetical protein